MVLLLPLILKLIRNKMATYENDSHYKLNEIIVSFGCFYMLWRDLDEIPFNSTPPYERYGYRHGLGFWKGSASFHASAAF